MRTVLLHGFTGYARSFAHLGLDAVTPDLPNRWRAGGGATARLKRVNWRDKTLASAASTALVRHQMRRITRDRDPTGGTHPLHAFVCDQRAQRRALGRYREWLEARA